LNDTKKCRVEHKLANFKIGVNFSRGNDPRARRNFSRKCEEIFLTKRQSHHFQKI